MLSDPKHVEKSPSSVIVVVECLSRGICRGKDAKDDATKLGRDLPRQHRVRNNVTPENMFCQASTRAPLTCQ